MNQIHEQQKLLQNMVTRINEQYSERADQAYLQMTYDYSETLLNAKLEWAVKTIARLKKRG